MAVREATAGPARPGALPPGADRLLLPDARLGVRGRGRRPGDDAAGLAQRRRASRAARACARGSTASPPTSASTCSARSSGGPGPWRWARPRRPTSRYLGPMLPEATWVTPIPDARRRARGRRPGRGRPVPRVDPPRLRHRAPAPPGPPAGRADPLRGAALAGRRGGRAPRHERGRRQQRPAAGPGHAARPAGRADARTPSTRRRRAAGALRRRLRALRHRAAGDAAARGRRPVDAAVRHVDPGRGQHRPLDGRARAERVPGLAPASPPRPTAARPSGSTGRTRPAGTRRGRCRCSRSRAGKIAGMQFFLAPPRPRAALPRVRPARSTSTPSPASSSSSPQRRGDLGQDDAGRRAARASRARRATSSTAPRSGAPGALEHAGWPAPSPSGPTIVTRHQSWTSAITGWTGDGRAISSAAGTAADRRSAGPTDESRAGATSIEQWTDRDQRSSHAHP